MKYIKPTISLITVENESLLCCSNGHTCGVATDCSCGCHGYNSNHKPCPNKHYIDEEDLIIDYQYE